MNKTVAGTPSFFSLDQTNGVPIYRQIIRQIEYAILSGRMQSGDKLPTIRSLSVELKTNPNTIAKAYSELEIRGILVTQVGSGTFISDKKPETKDDGRELKINALVARFLQDMKALGVERDETIKLIEGFQDENNKKRFDV
ncbi:MAG: GntR family transcriptional regulator [Spirochaetaceae bacterium]|jgi:GntR family transcriptional regulator|nr:GntR family transcriptional regulator [Spirochaetaceae bacterium]